MKNTISPSQNCPKPDTIQLSIDDEISALGQAEKGQVFVESDDALRAPKLYWSQWMVSKNLRDIASRRTFPTEMSIAFANCTGVVFLYRNGTPYDIPDIDEVFGDDDDFRWLSTYLACDGSGVFPRHISTKKERLRLINLFLKLRYPQCRVMLEP